MNQWSQKSQDRLATCHQDLQTLANAVLQIHDCMVVTGHRDQETQERMVREGKSKVHWPNGKHNSWPSRAIDLAPYVNGISPWDYEYSLYFAGIVLGVAEMLRSQGMMQHAIRWGGNWTVERDNPQRTFKGVSFYDGLHFELA